MAPSEFDIAFRFGKISGTIRRNLGRVPPEGAGRDALMDVADAVADAYECLMTGGLPGARRAQFLATCGFPAEEGEPTREERNPDE